MKNKFLLFILIFVGTQTNGQKLGLSSFSSSSQRNIEDSHRLYTNIGEPIINSTTNEYSIIQNGLLNANTVKDQGSVNLQVRFYFDENQNGLKDLTEYYLEQGAFSINNRRYQNFSKDGVFFTATNGTYNVTYETGANDFWELSSAETVTITISDSNFEDVRFGLHPIEENSKLNTYLISDNFRCGFSVGYSILISNLGSVEEEKIVRLSIDDRINNINYYEEPDIEIDEHNVGWFINLKPFESRVIEYWVRAPLIQEVGFGSIFNTCVWVENATPRTDFCLNQEMRCAYDPNDKLVNPSRPDSLSLLTTPLTYTLRFQNTGNDYAEDVVVSDTISEYLDISTFRVLHTSHPNQLTVIQDYDNPRFVDFRFDNIYLPDSTTNLIGSNGHVMFTITPLEGLPEDTEINNTGHIYFDFNPAIVTNTTSTTLVESFPTSSTFSEGKLNELYAFPNPTKGIIFLNKPYEKIDILNINGAIMGTFKNTNQINIAGYIPGNYVLKLQSELKEVYKREYIKIILVD